MYKILVTGGTGLVGQKIIELLRKQGAHEVFILSRNPDPLAEVKEFYWDIHKKEIDESALNVDFIIHLAGAGVADKRWTEDRKQEILDSRVESTKLLFEEVKEKKIPLKGFISASAVGYYGFGNAKHTYTEDHTPADDFLAMVVQKWEEEVFNFSTLDIRTVALRIGIVLSEEGGALEKMVPPVKFGVGAPLGSGKQMMSWIHIDDLARMFVWSIENESLKGVYNAVAPNPVSNKEMTRKIAKVLGKPLILPNVPSLALKLALGEMAEMVLNGNKVSSDKIEETGFLFDYPELEPALESLLK